MNKFSGFNDLKAYSDGDYIPNVPVEEGDTKFEQFKDVILFRVNCRIESLKQTIQDAIYDELDKAIKEVGKNYGIKLKDSESTTSATLPNVTLKTSLNIFPVAFEYSHKE